MKLLWMSLHVGMLMVWLFTLAIGKTDFQMTVILELFHIGNLIFALGLD